MSLLSMMRSVLTLKRPSIAQDAAGGVEQEPFRTIISNVPCDVQTAGIMVQNLYAQRNSEVSTTIYAARDTGAQANDIVEVVDQDGNTLIFLVRGSRKELVNRRQSPYQIDCMYIQTNREGLNV